MMRRRAVDELQLCAHKLLVPLVDPMRQAARAQQRLRLGGIWLVKRVAQ